MGLETTTTIAGLVATNPVASDPVGQADDHLRLLKNVLKTIFPGAGGAGFNIPITASETELNYVAGVTSAIQTQLNTISAAASTADGKAVTADGKAVDAQADATQALADAATADGKAVTADGKAVAAQSTANTAVSDAANALSVANTKAAVSNAARAWVTFTDDYAGNCTIVEGSSNVTSVTTGTDGVYDINFSPSLTNANYAVFATCHGTVPMFAVAYSAASSSVQVRTYNAAGGLDNTGRVSVMVLSID